MHEIESVHPVEERETSNLHVQLNSSPTEEVQHNASVDQNPEEVVTLVTKVEYASPEGSNENHNSSIKPQVNEDLNHIGNNFEELPYLPKPSYRAELKRPLKDPYSDLREGVDTIIRMPQESQNNSKDNKPKEAEEQFVSKSEKVVATIIKDPTGNSGQEPTLIGENEYYDEWVEDILDAFPNRGPPYTPTKLNNFIWIGSLVNSEDETLLKRIGITHVLNMAGTRRFDLEKNPYDTSVGVKGYLMIPAEDVEDYDIVRHFSNAFAFIDRCKKAQGQCLIHCNLGVNRSGAVCAGYLMFDTKKYLLQVITDMKKARQVVLTNRGFRYQLINYARLKHRLDPIARKSGLPVTIPPPTGHSKFANNSKTSSMMRMGEPNVPSSSEFLPAKATSGAHRARKAYQRSYSSDGIDLPPRPKSACGSLMEPPVSSLSFTRPSSAMGVHRHSSKIRPYSLSDAEVDDYTSGFSPDDYSGRTSSYISYASFKPKYSYTPTYNKYSSKPKTLGLSILREGLSYGGDRRTLSYLSEGSSGTSSSSLGYSRSTTTPLLERQWQPRSAINILKNTRGVGQSNGLGTSSYGYNYSTPSTSNRPYSTISIPRLGGLTFNVPKPPFGTSRRRFGPSRVSTFY